MNMHLLKRMIAGAVPFVFSVLNFTELSAQCTGSGNAVDTFGVKMLYPTNSSGAAPWMLGIGNFTGRMKDSQKVNGTGLNTTMDLNGQERNSVYATTPCDGITDHKKAATQGYMCTAKDWKNFEMTCYFYTTDLGGDEFTMYGRGGRHTGSGYPDGCLGSAYKASVNINGQTRWGKEQWHVSYDYNGGGGWKSSGVAVNGKWVGYKILMYNVGAGTNPDVVIELWLDDGNNATAPSNQWKLVNKVTDKGGWGSDGAECGGTPDQKIIWGGPLVTFRTDLGGVKIKWASVREIDPNGTFSNKPAVTISKQDAGCGNSAGSATASASGGTGNYQYSWSNGQTAATASGLQPGTYTVTVTEGSGCTNSAIVTINSIPTPVVGETVSNVKCKGGNDGAVSLNVTGGASPYSYLWSTSDTACKKLTVTAVTANGDDGNVPANVLDNDLLTRWSYNGVGAWIRADLGSKQTICSVDIAWYSGNTRSSNFVIALSDDGINFTSVYTSTSSGTTLSHEKYTFAKTAARYIRITVNGNTSNNWASITELAVNGSSGATTKDVTGLRAGTYTVNVKDNNNCTVIRAVTITEPAALSASTSFTPDNGNSTGTATANPSGGTAPYSYVWSTNPVQTSGTATGLSSGNYTVTITDKNGCTFSSVVVVSIMTGIESGGQLQSVFLYPNPTYSGITLSLDIAPSHDPYTLLIRNTLGQLVFAKELQIRQAGKTELYIPLDEAGPGIYFLSVTGSAFNEKIKFSKR